MNWFKTYIARLLAILIGISLFPYNALHFHAESHHLEALYAPEGEGHRCELDLNHCQGEYNHNCEHQQHIGSSHAKCFFCQFHFYKGYLLSEFQQENLPQASGIIYRVWAEPILVQNEKKYGNKDPPSASLLV